jgi:hypothetical protein
VSYPYYCSFYQFIIRDKNANRDSKQNKRTTSRRLTLEERGKAAKYKLETGVSYPQLSKWLEKQIGVKVSVSTLSGKFQQKEGQAMFIDGSRHNIRDGEYALLEDFLYKWITDGNISLTRDIVRQKALQNIWIFYPHKKDKISPSNHWLQNFSQRYGIKSLRTSNKRKSVTQKTIVKSPRISDERKSATSRLLKIGENAQVSVSANLWTTLLRAQ